MRDVFEIGDLVNHTYRIERVLGRGGMGAVYLARHDVTYEQVAIKVLKSEVTDNNMHRDLMNRERAVRAVNHPAVIRYFELGQTGSGDLYLVMDFVDGTPLDKMFASGPMAPAEAIELGRRVAEGLSACHRRGVIHRDISPDNVLLRGGRVDQPVIIDFGIAKHTSGTDETTVIGGQFAGKYTYAPPEQFQGHVDARSDLYALGVTLVAALRGRAPSFGSNDFQLVQNKQRPLDLSDIPTPLRAVLSSMTHPHPERRPSSADEFVNILNDPDFEFDEEESTGANVKSPIQKPFVEPEEIVKILPSGRGYFVDFQSQKISSKRYDKNSYAPRTIGKTATTRNILLRIKTQLGILNNESSQTLHNININHIQIRLSLINKMGAGDALPMHDNLIECLFSIQNICTSEGIKINDYPILSSLHRDLSASISDLHRLYPEMKEMLGARMSAIFPSLNNEELDALRKMLHAFKPIISSHLSDSLEDDLIQVNDTITESGYDPKRWDFIKKSKLYDLISTLSSVFVISKDLVSTFLRRSEKEIKELGSMIETAKRVVVQARESYNILQKFLTRVIEYMGRGDV